MIRIFIELLLWVFQEWRWQKQREQAVDNRNRVRRLERIRDENDETWAEARQERKAAPAHPFDFNDSPGGRRRIIREEEPLERRPGPSGGLIASMTCLVVFLAVPVVICGGFGVMLLISAATGPKNTNPAPVAGGPTNPNPPAPLQPDDPPKQDPRPNDPPKQDPLPKDPPKRDPEPVQPPEPTVRFLTNKDGVPAPRTPNSSLTPTKSFVLDDLEFKEIARGNGCWVQWAADGESFYLLRTNEQRLSRVSLDGLKVLRELDVGVILMRPAMSASGLLVPQPSRRELWQLDPDTFDVTLRVTLPAMQHVLSAPTLKTAIVVREPKKLTLLDLEKRQVKSEQTIAQGEFELPVCTNDGKYLLGANAFNTALSRFRLADDNLILEERTKTIGLGVVGHGGICTSDDSRYLCLPAASGNRVSSKQPSPDEIDLCIYAVNDLKKPLLSIKPGRNPQAVAFDPKTEQVYCSCQPYLLMTFDKTGQLEKKYARPTTDRWFDTQIAVHPKGRTLLLVTDNAVFLVTPVQP
jgi:hypothetical protein